MSLNVLDVTPHSNLKKKNNPPFPAYIQQHQYRKFTILTWQQKLTDQQSMLQPRWLADSSTSSLTNWLTAGKSGWEPGWLPQFSLKQSQLRRASTSPPSSRVTRNSRPKPLVILCYSQCGGRVSSMTINRLLLSISGVYLPRSNKHQLAEW